MKPKATVTETTKTLKNDRRILLPDVDVATMERKVPTAAGAASVNTIPMSWQPLSNLCSAAVCFECPFLGFTMVKT